MDNQLNTLHTIAFTHRNLPVSEIGNLHIDPNDQKERLTAFKTAMNLEELQFLSTCNRVEFLFVTDDIVDHRFLHRFFNALYPNLSDAQRTLFADSAEDYTGINAVEHLFSVASSVESMVVGEREIITQVRKAFEDCRKMQLTGDTIRLVMRLTIETAKKVYTETNIARRPVSVVSLAYHKLRDLNVPMDSRILIIGAGVTNTNMSRFLRKHGFEQFHVFNRTFEKAEKLASDLNGKAHKLDELNSFDGGFDVIITCTGAEKHIITKDIYKQLLQGETDRKIVIDIAIPQDLSPEIIADNNITHISVEVLQEISNANLKERSKEIQHVEQIISEALYEFEHIHQSRIVELAMRSVPEKVKEIRSNAIENVFHNELASLDNESREVVEKIMGYMEKKYMSMPMLMAKEILLKKR
ncbi:glutamyl-tRNA reductase [Crocinitomicaceae bacterium]|nr:glutamyl-tRNA reductase [Crocinitomicaceae bacterium]